MNCINKKDCKNKYSYECIGCEYNNDLPNDEKLWNGFRQKKPSIIKAILSNIIPV